MTAGSAVERPRRILVVTLRYPPYVAGGYELLTRDLVEGLRERGHEVCVLTGRGARLAGVEGVLPLLEPDLDAHADLFRHSFDCGNAERFRLHFLRLGNWTATRRALIETRSELLFFANLGLVSLAPVLAARHLGVPTLGYVCDPWPANHWVRAWREDPSQRATKPLRLEALERFWRGFRDLAGLGPLLVASEHLARGLAAEGIDRETLRVVPIGLSPAMEAAARAVKPRRRRRGSRLRVVCTSMHWRGKGVHVLLDAARRAREAGVQLELCLAGSGGDEYARELEALAAHPALAGCVSFAGMLDAAGVSAALARAHVLVFPSLWEEPFGLVSIEAMAHGCAVIVSDAGGIPEQIEHGVHGLVVPAGDAEALAAGLVRLDGDEDERLALARAGRERAFATYGHARWIDALEDGVAAALGCREARVEESA